MCGHNRQKVNETYIGTHMGRTIIWNKGWHFATNMGWSYLKQKMVACAVRVGHIGTYIWGEEGCAR